MDEVGLGKRLQQVRREAGLTQQQLCSKASISYSTLAKIERGAIKSPSIFTVHSIAAAVGTSLDELLGGTPVRGNDSNKRTSRGGIRFVYFDLNDCMVRLHTSAFTEMAQDSGQPIDVVESVYWRYNDAVNSGQMSLDELNTIWAERLGIMVDWKGYYLRAVDAMPGVGELITEVAKYYYVGILSNTNPGFIDALKEKGLIPNIAYDAIVDSSQVHVMKPDPKIYEIAATKASMSSNEILLVDDTRPNLITAENLGWHSLWFDAYNPTESIAAVRSVLDLA